MLRKGLHGANGPFFVGLAAMLRFAAHSALAVSPLGSTNAAWSAVLIFLVGLIEHIGPTLEVPFGRVLFEGCTWARVFFGRRLFSARLFGKSGRQLLRSKFPNHPGEAAAQLRSKKAASSRELRVLGAFVSTPESSWLMVSFLFP